MDIGPMNRLSLREHLGQRPQLIAFTLCLACIFSRGWDRLLHPHLWAEDGAVFLLGALDGVSLFSASAGYIQFGQRLIASLTLLFPLNYTPVLFCLCSYLFFSYVASLFAAPTFEWLVPSVRLRLLFCVLCCFAPGLHEILGNLANMYNVGLLGLALIGLRSLDYRLRTTDAFFGSFVSASAGATMLLGPLFIFRVFIQRKRGMSWTELTPTLWIVGAIAIFFCLSTLTAKSLASIEHIGASALAHNYSAILFANLLLAPLAGTTMTAAFISNVPAVLYLGFILSIPIILTTTRHLDRPNLLQLLLFQSAILLLPLLSFLVRPQAIQIISPEVMGTADYWMLRYSFQIYCAGALLWIAALSRLRTRAPRWSVPITSAILLAGSVLSTSFAVPRYGDRAWTSDSRELSRAVRLGETAIVPIYPNGWIIKYEGRGA